MLHTAVKIAGRDSISVRLEGKTALSANWAWQTFVSAKIFVQAKKSYAVTLEIYSAVIVPELNSWYYHSYIYICPGGKKTWKKNSSKIRNLPQDTRITANVVK